MPVSWPLWPYPAILVLWLLGMNYLIWPLIGVVVLLALAQRRSVVIPRRFGLWMLFLAWVVLSATQLSGIDRAMSLTYRLSMYGSATALFLYLCNTKRIDLPTRAIVNLVAVAWSMLIVGGVLGMIAPSIQLQSPVEMVLPRGLTQIPLVEDMVTPSFAKEKAFVGLGIHRTQAPFPYPNAWGSNFVLLLPFAIWSFARFARRGWRLVLGGLLVFSIVPLFFSLNRGAWLALALGVVYAGARLLFAMDVRTIRWMALGITVLVFVVALTPLRGVLLGRIDHGYSDEGRVGRNLVALDLVLQRPFLGYGAPQSSDDNPANASVGTHGQLWLLLVSQGFPGLALYLSWFCYLAVRSGRRLRSARDIRFWPHLVIVLALFMLPYYELLPLQIHTMMIAAALICRDGLPDLQPRRRGFHPVVMEGSPA